MLTFFAAVLLSATNPVYSDEPVASSELESSEMGFEGEIEEEIAFDESVIDVDSELLEIED